MAKIREPFYDAKIHFENDPLLYRRLQNHPEDIYLSSEQLEPFREVMRQNPAMTVTEALTRLSLSDWAKKYS